MPKPAKPSGIAADIEAMRSLGMTNEQIQATIMRASNPIVHVPADGGAPTVLAPQPTLTPQTSQQRQDQAVLGPDPEIVARYEEKMKTYVPPVLEETFEVTLPTRRADYVRRWAARETAIRQAKANQRGGEAPLEITPAKAIELIVGLYWQIDPDRANLATGGSVTREVFQKQVAG